jgi:hypothetical protein
MVRRVNISLSAQSAHGIGPDRTPNEPYRDGEGKWPIGLLHCLLPQDGKFRQLLLLNKKSMMLLEYVPWMFMNSLNSFFVF